MLISAPSARSNPLHTDRRPALTASDTFLAVIVIAALREIAQVICWDRGRPARNEREARKDCHQDCELTARLRPGRRGPANHLTALTPSTNSPKDDPMTTNHFSLGAGNLFCCKLAR